MRIKRYRQKNDVTQPKLLCASDIALLPTSKNHSSSLLTTQMLIRMSLCVKESANLAPNKK